MNYKKLQYLVFLFAGFLITLSGCGKYDLKYSSIAPEDDIVIMDKMYSRIMDSSELYFAFTKGYKNTRLRVYENGQKKFDSIISTGSQKVLGLAKVIRIKKKSDIIIHFDNLMKPLKISRQQMKGYKSIYISKKQNHFDILFDNKRKHHELNSK
jgi:hypothetical protein